MYFVDGSTGVSERWLATTGTMLCTNEGESVGLTDRELEVLQLSAKGYTYQEATDLLHLSVNTIDTHTRHVYRKLAVSPAVKLYTKQFGWA